MNQNNSKKDKATTHKKPYTKPKIRTESLTAVAAVCNGSTAGGRKSVSGSPDFCSVSRLKS